MMSRAKYKGNKIEWYPDDCASPLPQPQQKQRTPPWQNAPTTQAKKTVQPLVNRFGVLDMDGTDEASSGAEEDLIPMGMGQGGIALNWADGAVAA